MQLYKQPVDGELGRSARDRSQHLYLTQTLEVRFGSLADVRHLDSELESRLGMRPSRPTMCHKQTFNLNPAAARAIGPSCAS